MRSERWSTNCERMKVLKDGAAGPVLQYENGDCWSFEGEGHVMILGVSGSGKSRRGTIPMTKSFIQNSVQFYTKCKRYVLYILLLTHINNRGGEPRE